MASQPVSSLTALTGANVDPTADFLYIVDTSLGVNGSKKILVSELFLSSPAAIYVGASDVQLTRYAVKQLMISGDGVGTSSGNVGLVIGNIGGASPTFGGIYPSNVTQSALNYALATDGSNTYLNGLSTLNLATNGTLKLSIAATAGAGPAITAGTAASAVSAETITQTRNFNTSATDYLKYSFTLTSTHASDNIFAYYGGAGGVTSLLTLSAAGVLGIGTGGSTTISTGVGSVRMSTANAATNTAWIPIAYAGTTYFVPAYTTNAP